MIIQFYFGLGVRDINEHTTKSDAFQDDDASVSLLMLYRTMRNVKREMKINESAIIELL